MTLRRAVLLAVAAVAVLLLAALWPQLRGPPRRLEDRVGLIPAAEERNYNQHLEWVRQESGFDIHLVLVPDTRGLSPQQFALATMRELGVGKETGGRGLLVLYDTTARTMRLEAGPRLEGILPDAFLGYLMGEHLDPMFGAGRPATLQGVRAVRVSSPPDRQPRRRMAWPTESAGSITLTSWFPIAQDRERESPISCARPG